MTFLILLTLVVAVTLQIAADPNDIWHNNQFLIYNKKYSSSRIAMWSSSSVGTHDYNLYPDQLWKLTRHTSMRDCYYFSNEVYPLARIADYKGWFVVYSGHFYNDQLFKLVPSGSGDDYFYIYNCYYTNDRMAKYGSGNSQVTMYSGRKYPDQLWKFVPRITSTFKTEGIFHLDNRQGSATVTRQISVTTGITRSSSSSIENKKTLEMSITSSIEKLGMALGLTAQWSSEVTTAFSKSETISWEKTEIISFTIPAGKNFKIMQHVIKFRGPFTADSSSLRSSIKVFESDTHNFPDPDGFVISYKK